MKFCPNCQFMYHLVETEHGIQYKCNNCKHTEENVESLVHITHYKVKEYKDSIPGEYQKDNVTLPRTKKKVCPNEACVSRKDPTLQEAIFYNEKNTVKLTFLCVHCLSSWNYG